MGRKGSAQGMAAAAANRVQHRYPLGPYGGKLEKVSGNQKYLPQFGIYTEPCSQPTRLAPGILGHDLGHRRPYLGYHNAAKRVELPLRRAANQQTGNGSARWLAATRNRSGFPKQSGLDGRVGKTRGAPIH